MNSIPTLDGGAPIGSLRSSRNTLTLVVLVIFLGGITALVLDYSFRQRDEIAGGDLTGMAIIPYKSSYSIGEGIRSNIVLVNNADSSLFVAQVDYSVTVFDITNASIVNKVYNSFKSHPLLTPIRVEPKTTYTIELGEIWSQRDAMNQQVARGRYLVEVKLKGSTAMTEVITIG